MIIAPADSPLQSLGLGRRLSVCDAPNGVLEVQRATDWVGDFHSCRGGVHVVEGYECVGEYISGEGGAAGDEGRMEGDEIESDYA